jgi:DNA-binding winged helix-turn-helix (wHTH) protein
VAVRLRFADCVLDTEMRELRRGGQATPLSPKAYQLLEVLVLQRPGAVSHEDLRRALWPDSVAGGTTLARLVNEVRAAIGDSAAGARIIRTVHRFGYAFADTGAVDIAAAGPMSPVPCAVQWGERQVALAMGENLIGRSPEALISVSSARVSRRHAQILVTESGASIKDLGSRNGTYVAGERIAGSVALKDQDRIAIGPATLIFLRAGYDDATAATDSKG